MAIQRKSRADLGERADQRGPLAAIVFGQRLRLNLRQTELADLAGCSTTFIHEVEAGKTSLQWDKVLDVLDALGLGITIGTGSRGITLNPESIPDA